MENGRRKKRLYAAVLICWIAFTIIVFLFSSRFETIKINPAIFDFNQSSENHLDAFSYIRFDELNNKRPAYGIAFNSLDLENISVGPFTTAMFRKAIIQGLEVKIYNYAEAIEEKSESIVQKIDTKKIAEETTKVFRNPSNTHSFGKINLSNVAEALINGFDCKFYDDDDLSLSIMCKKATVTKNGEMELRGHVIIKTGDGSILESNFAQWDIKQNNFKIKNSYILNQNGSVKTGRNKIFNSRLQEEHKCTAKL